MVNFNTVTDRSFDANYPKKVAALSGMQWTPINVAKRAAGFLVTNPGTRVLDIGSGCGKFCLVGAGVTNGHFTGVEQRGNLHQCAVKLADALGIENVEFVHDNIINIDFSRYNAFYYANSFYENISEAYAIDGQYPLSERLFNIYINHVHEQLKAMPRGTRVATYWAVMDMPDNYVLMASECDGMLNLWVKT